MFKPLNPLLYSRLSTVFGSVKVSNEGEEMMSRYASDPVTGESVIDISHPGEYYHVCCPFCGDTRHRLYINHKWGVKDKLNRSNLWLAICYNDNVNCLASFENRTKLYDMVFVPGMDKSIKIRPGKKVDTESRTSQLPGPIIPLKDLPYTHPANSYLLSRLYDINYLSDTFGVGYCPNSFYRLAQNRIIAPLYMGGELKGWQARHIGELPKVKDAPPKWWSDPAMRRSKVLYNFDVAKQYKTGIITEGFGDVWRVGSNAVATLGATMTAAQQKLFIEQFKDYSAVLLFDPDAMDPKTETGKRSVAKLISDLKPNFKKGFAAVVLPHGFDPGDLDEYWLKQFITEQAKMQSVEVSWDKR